MDTGQTSSPDNECFEGLSGSGSAAPPRETKAKVSELVCMDGPATLVVLVGQPRGRWTGILEGSASACRQVKAVIARAAGSCELVAAAQRASVIVGIAVVRGWHCVRDSASHAHTYALMLAAAAFYSKRSEQRFVEHAVIASATVMTPCSGGQHDLTSVLAWSGCIAGSSALDQLLSVSAVARVTKGRSAGLDVPIGELVLEWLSSYGAAIPASVVWPVDHKLAIALAKGQWFGDVSVRFRRQCPGENTMALVGPSAAVIRSFLSLDIGQPSPPPEPEGPEGLAEGSGGRAREKQSSLRRFRPEHIMNCLRIVAPAGSKALAKGMLRTAARWFGLRQSNTTAAIGEIPAPSQTYRHVVRVDFASMLARRAWYKKHGPTFRYLAFDASPQKGHEIFVTVERVVLRDDVAAFGASPPRPAVQERLLPVVVLGSGRMSLADKAQAHVHQVWLDYGPSVDSVRLANADVRQCLSDMGTEFGISEVRDLVPECVGQHSHHQSGELVDRGHLYPFALQVLGPQHIVDAVVQLALATLPWWPEWMRVSKVVCQWLRSTQHRELLQERLRQVGGDADSVEARVKSLDRSCEGFANWRWGTLVSVCRDLARMDDAVRASVAAFRSASEFSSRDAGAAQELYSACRDDAFWQRVGLLQKFVAPMASFSSWLRGCSCHDQERKQGHAVVCPWQGCRARELAGRTEGLFAELQALRAALHLASDLVLATTTVLSSLQLKMAWLFDEPYLVWQADSSEVAASIIKKHDALVASGKLPHRVTRYLAGGDESSLRADLEAHAAGQGMSPALRREVLAYQMCKVDDTWAEAAHRDVSRFVAGRPTAKVPYIAAHQRLRQTLASVDEMSPIEVEHFHQCVRGYKAIAQPDPTRSKKLRGAKRKFKEIAAEVYRIGSVGLRDWKHALGPALQLAVSQGGPGRSVVQRLQVEYLTNAITDGQLYSLPQHLPIRDRDSECDAAALTLVADRPTRDLRFFVLVDKSSGRKKALRTASSLQRKVAMPVSVQPMRCFGGVGQHESAVEHDGLPHEVDLLQMSSWSDFRTGLRQWASEPSSVPGVIGLGSSTIAHAPTCWRNESTPTLCILEGLVAAGWSRGKSPPEHTAASAKTFGVRDPIASKSYLRCLLGLTDLVGDSVGQLDALRSDQNASYYSCVLQTQSPSIVPLDRDAKTYQAMLSRGEFVDEPLPLQDVVALGPEEDEALFVEGSGRSSASAAPRIAQVDRPQRKGSCRQPAIVADVGGDWGDLVGLEGSGQPARRQAAAAGSASSSNRGVGQPIQLAPVVDVAAPEGTGAPAERVGFDFERPVVEGVLVYLESHGVLDTPNSYRRCVVACPAHGGQKGGCKKTRVFGTRAGLSTDLGDLEPYAFLGAWLVAGQRFEDAASHKRHVPSIADVRAYAASHGW